MLVIYLCIFRWFTIEFIPLSFYFLIPLHPTPLTDHKNPVLSATSVNSQQEVLSTNRRTNTRKLWHHLSRNSPLSPHLLNGHLPFIRYFTPRNLLCLTYLWDIFLLLFNLWWKNKHLCQKTDCCCCYICFFFLGWYHRVGYVGDIYNDDLNMQSDLNLVANNGGFFIGIYSKFQVCLVTWSNLTTFLA